MIYFTHAEIDQLITEGLPLHDETTRALGMPDVPGTLSNTERFCRGWTWPRWRHGCGHFGHLQPL
ncbi:MAG: hypothetical protein PHQ58_15895 [Rhodoferax sp.]|uniref:hypothetical protein n=1 Tax=Rhodoferax sp. TaxID=50421 RepID=UPI00261F92BC|nr:hypothetical protein [Rhodoferax sp.]MDD2881910.1 hypothetical protein [Rhodoferax sp.]